jgi:hypothetical protein
MGICPYGAGIKIGKAQLALPFSMYRNLSAFTFMNSGPHDEVPSSIK